MWIIWISNPTRRKRLNLNFTYRSFQSHSNPDAYAKIIKIYALDRAFGLGEKLHAHLIINGFARLTIIASRLVAFYSECGKLSHARKVFDKIPTSDIPRCIVVIGSYARCGFYEAALDVFWKMQREGLRPNRYVIPSILRACGHVGDSITGKNLHGMIFKCRFEDDAFVSSALTDMYSKCGQVEEARLVFDGLSEKDVVSLNAVVSGYAKHGLAEQALALVETMQLLGVKPNLVTWNSLLAGFSQQDDEVKVSEVFRLMVHNGVEPDVVSWTSIISGSVRNFHYEEAFRTFKQILFHGMCPTSSTITCLLPACATATRITQGKEIHAYALVIGVGEDVYVQSALEDMYAKCGYITEARTIFNKMLEKNTVTWNSMIFGYANHGYCQEALELFDLMEKEEKAKLDHLTFTAALTACGHAGRIEYGQSLFKMMQEKHGIVPRLEHYACMVDLLGRAGKLSEGYGMIKTMPIEPDLFIWGALLAACRNHGNAHLAEIAARHLFELEPVSAGNLLLLSNLYADAGKWRKVASLKKHMKRKKLKKLPGCSWMRTV